MRLLLHILIVTATAGYRHESIPAAEEVLAPGDTGYFPLAWEKPFGDGRVLYTALGHREDVWRSAWFRAHIAGAMQWAMSPARPRRRAVRH